MPEPADGFQKGGNPPRTTKEAAMASLTSAEENVFSAMETLILWLPANSSKEPPPRTHTRLFTQQK